VNGVEVRELVPASRKLGAAAARELARAARRVIVAKGKAVRAFEPGGAASKDLVEAMLGPTGNLRAPTIRVGTTVVVGFDEATYQDALS
jgi:hypothetical protein